MQTQKEEGEMGKLNLSAICLVLLICGCSGLQLQTDREKMNLYDKTTKAYDLAVRWGEWEDALAFLKRSGQDDALPDLEDYRQVRVTAVKVKNTIIDKQSLSIAQRVVDIQYYRMSNVTVKNLQNRQVWEYNEEEDRWYLISGLPVFE
jgi:hypothetical protein